MTGTKGRGTSTCVESMPTVALIFAFILSLAPFVGSQTIGDISSCRGDRYTSRNDLLFYTDCAGAVGSRNSSADYFYSEDSDNAQTCMDDCAVSRPVCYGIVFYEDSCYFYEEDLYPLNVTGFAAVADASQLQPPNDDDALACPYDPYSTVTITSTNEEFQIICDADFGGEGGDYCPDNLADAQCPRHADTLMECMEVCSQAHPLCKGVSFDPAMLGGFGNCYLKREPQSSFTPADGYTSHSARVTEKLAQDIVTQCQDAEDYDSGGRRYEVVCTSEPTESQNITSVHSSSLDECLGHCSTGEESSCVGVLFDMGLDNGYENCYVLNSTSEDVRSGSNTTFARAVGASSDQTNGQSAGDSDEGEGKGGGSKAWIAGPVVAGLVVIGAAVGVYFPWRRRYEARKTKATAAQSPAPGDVQMPIVPQEKAAEPMERHELRDPNSERMWPPQMQA